MNSSPGRVVFFGTPHLAVAILKELQGAGWEIPLVITQPDQPTGRSGKLIPSPVATYATQHGLSVQKPLKPLEAKSGIEQAAPQVLVVAAYGHILPVSLLEVAPFGALNVHVSLLPAYRGASPVQQAILDGQSETGVSIMKMDKELDTGPVVSQVTIPIALIDTTGSLTDKLARAGGQLLVKTLPDYLAGRIQPQPQDDAQASTTRLLSKKSGQINWTFLAEQVLRHIRAVQPWPGAWTQINGEMIQVLEAVPATSTTPPASGPTLLPGQFASSPAGTELTVGTGSNPIQLIRVQPAGRRAMKAADWARGYRGPQQFV